MNDAEIDDNDRFTGTVVEFDARRGFGFLMPEDEEDKAKQVFCHWKDVESDDRWPRLKKKMVVEYTPVKNKGKVKATKITMVGGEKINIGEDSDKNYNMDTKYKGKVEFYDALKGFGFIKPILESDETIEWAGETLDKKKGLYVAREEIITDSTPVGLNDGMKVEFNIYHGSKGLAAGRVCAVGGGKIVYKSGGQKRRRGKGWGGRGRGGWSGMKMMRGMGMGMMGGMGMGMMGGMGMGRGMFPPRRGGFGAAGTDPSKIEVGLYVENNNIGPLIGKGGETVKQIRKDSGGANIQFADFNQRSFSNRQVVSILGDEDQVSSACVDIHKKLQELTDGYEPGLTFLIPNSYCGMFIGKKGSSLKEVEETGVKVNVTKMPVQLPGGSLVALADVKGDAEQIEEACKVVVPMLGKIAQKVIQDQMGWSSRGR